MWVIRSAWNVHSCVSFDLFGLFSLLLFFLYPKNGWGWGGGGEAFHVDSHLRVIAQEVDWIQRCQKVSTWSGISIERDNLCTGQKTWILTYLLHQHWLSGSGVTLGENPSFILFSIIKVVKLLCDKYINVQSLWSPTVLKVCPVSADMWRHQFTL